MKKILVLAVVAAAALVFASAAFPSSLTCAHGSTCPPGDGNLPFTGLDLAGIAGTGGLLLLSGLMLHRVSRRRR